MEKSEEKLYTHKILTFMYNKQRTSFNASKITGMIFMVIGALILGYAFGLL